MLRGWLSIKVSSVILENGDEQTLDRLWPDAVDEMANLRQKQRSQSRTSSVDRVACSEPTSFRKFCIHRLNEGTFHLPPESLAIKERKITMFLRVFLNITAGLLQKLDRFIYTEGVVRLHFTV